jgi:1,4-alpha-glucan branching enzyme
MRRNSTDTATKARSSSRKPQLSSKEVVFECFASEAKKVALGGDFNQWKPEKNPLTRERDGKWRTVLMLPAGRYEYRYWVDGNWQNDQRSVECVPNAFGTWNCVVEVR